MPEWPGKPWILCVCPACGRYYATSTAKNQLFCSGIGSDRHAGMMAERVPVVRADRRERG